MKELAEDVVRLLRQQEAERLRIEPPPMPERPTLHYTELPAGMPDSPIAAEWDLYRREVGRLLAEGHQGRWLLIAQQEIVGLWDTEEQASRVRSERFGVQPVL